MAKQIIELLIDDLDGKTTVGVESVEFGLDGHRYTIDLSEEHRRKLRATLDPFIMGGRSADRLAHARARAAAGTTATATARAAEQKAERKQQREWWATNWEAASLPQPGPMGRGRIPDEVKAAYVSHHGRPVRKQPAAGGAKVVPLRPEPAAVPIAPPLAFVGGS